MASFDILIHTISVPSTSPALHRAIVNFLNKERCIGSLRDFTAEDARNLLAERHILEQRARSSFRYVSR